MSSVKDFVLRHPRLTAWFVLAVGMVAILVWSARDVGLLAHQWAALIVATIGLAGLCVWIIGWEDEDEEGEEGAKEPTSEESAGEASVSADTERSQGVADQADPDEAAGGESDVDDADVEADLRTEPAESPGS
jgi:hypothetical protein